MPTIFIDDFEIGFVCRGGLNFMAAPYKYHASSAISKKGRFLFFQTVPFFTRCTLLYKQQQNYFFRLLSFLTAGTYPVQDS